MAMNTERQLTQGRPRPWWIAAFLVAVAGLAAGCSGGDPSDTNPIEAGGGTESATGPVPALGDGLAVRLAGTIDGDLLCPGGRRPCLPYQGDLQPEPDGAVWIAGRLTGGVLVIDDQLPLPDGPRRDYSNRCPDQVFIEAPSMELLEALHEDLTSQPPGYADLWDSDDGVFHIGIAGDDLAAAEAFLDEHGLGGQICLVAGFPYPDEMLEAVQSAVSQAARDHGYDGYGVGRDSWDGTVTIDLPRFDAGFRSRLDEISADHEGVPIIALAGVEVIGGTLDDYEAAVASAATTPDPSKGLIATCGPVVFSSIPPDLDEFPPLDDDARAALDELVNGPTGVEAGGFDEDVTWSIASRTDDELVLFGQRDDATEGSPWVDARFERRDGAWRPSGWGGCWVEISAVGLGPASVGTDPDDPPDASSTDLALLINEQACASGQAPVDREIVPVVTETDDTVTIVVLVAPVEGGADCPGNPWHPITVTLEAPLGERQLLDGHRHPPEPVTAVNPLELGD